MKIQLANKTYHQIDDGDCCECAFYPDRSIFSGEWNWGKCLYITTRCRFKPFKKQLFNDKIFKL